ncbi:hypothetical protein N3K66_002243 [Trichothecium roseum]|uniref:Uncharacterized protein n=1 Tax=Trichothecium roseum TaxID=47278 RepID=A0ACC0V8S8_9HYPO|nr:hypothetical protein N3K66_002243 [Trichothecium roseum]
MRLGWYAGVSTALAGSVVLSAFYQRPNFYSAMVYLAQSNFCMIALVNFTLLLYSGFLFSLVRLCFGRLRTIEIEQLTERAWIAITETCLAMTIFRDEMGAWFLVMFTLLVSGKLWGWIGDARVEVLEQQPPANPRLFHIRLSISLTMSCLYDVVLLHYSISTVIQQARPNMMVMFLFEFAVLMTTSLRTTARYILTLTEQRITKTQTRDRLEARRREVREERERISREREQAAAAGVDAPINQAPLPSEDDVDEMDIEVPGWEAKGEYVLWLDLVTDMVKLAIYVTFFLMHLVFYGLPIHIMRDLFLTARDFVKRLGALLRYRRAIGEMNQYPDATPEELAQENTCIICREEMRAWDPVNNPGAVDRVRPKKLPCGHTLHLGCLKSWLERQQVCPTCRRPVTSDVRPTNTQNNNAAMRIQLNGGVQAQGQQPQAPHDNHGHDHAPNQPQRHWQQGQNQQPQLPQQDQAAPQRNNAGGPRVFQIGPFRFALARGHQQLNELAQRFGMPPGAAANAGMAAGGAAAQAHAAPSARATQPSSGDNIQDAATLLQQAEQAFQREIQALQQRHAAIQTSQLLLAELQRLRQRQQLGEPQFHAQPQPVGIPTTGLPQPPLFTQNIANFLGPPGQAFPHMPGMPLTGVPPRMNSPIIGRHSTSGFTTSIPAGSPDLPDGVVLPPGWSLMPLQRYEGGQPPRQQSPQPAPAFNGPDLPSQGPSVPTQSELSVHSDAETRLSADSVAGSSNTATPPRTMERTPQVVSPSPVAPNWGGSSQLFAGPSQPLRADAGPEMTPTQEDAASRPAEEDVDDGEEGEGEQSKGKGRAATVEEADDSDSSDGV